MQQKHMELTRFSREQLSDIVKTIAKTKIIGTLFIGDFHNQEVRWASGGSVEVITEYTQGSWDNYPSNEVPKAFLGGNR